MQKASLETPKPIFPFKKFYPPTKILKENLKIKPIIWF